MSKYEDLFKSEIGTDGDKPLIDCPHCEAPITKSEILAKAKKAPSSNTVVVDNKDGKNHKGPESGHNSATPVRGAGAGSGKAVGQPTGLPGAHAQKAVDEDEDKKVQKSNVVGTDFVQYVNTGADEAIAKAIAEGSLGQGGIVNQPIDKNTSRTR